MLTLNNTIFTQVLDQAKQAAADSPSWLRAIEKAAEQIETNPFIFPAEDHLIIGSTSGNTYSANGVCQCEAFAHGRPCWHRAAARLVKRYEEAEQRQAKRAAYEQALAEIDELYA